LSGADLLGNHLTNSVEYSPSREANSPLASQEIPRLSWNPMVHYHVHRSPQLVPVLSQMSQVYTLKSCSSKTSFNIIFHVCPTGFPAKMFMLSAFQSCMSHPSLLLDFITLLILFW